ncbi:MAG: hypothetical protein ABMA64_29125 [Myxococcota bacterium]
MRWMLLWLSVGCWGGRRSTLSTSVSVIQQEAGARDVAVLEREDYEVLDIARGSATAQQVFLLWFPVGVQKTKGDLTETAYFEAVNTVERCDAILLPYTDTRTVVVPLLVVNFVKREVQLRGRCITLQSP